MLTQPAPEAESGATAPFLDGGGELGALMRGFDFTQTPLGPPATWPQSLKTAVRIMLTSRQPIWLGWGPELTYLYNDPYRSIIGGKHPHALGRPFREVWHEIWDVVGPMAERVMTRDEGTYVEAQQLIMQRHGYEEETYYTFSYSPIPGDAGGTAGLFCANTDDTRRVVGERQIRTLSELSAQRAVGPSRQEACALSVAALATNQHDLPFVLIFLTDANGELPGLAASTPGAAALTDVSAWPWAEVLATQQPKLVDLAAHAGPLPPGAWPVPPRSALVMPLGATGSAGRGGVLVTGLSPYRRFEADYRNFLELVAREVASNLANAEAHEQERQRAEALLALDRAKTEFFSNVSHEFRTPLTLMLGPLEDALTHSEALPDADRHRLELAHKNSLRLLKLVNTLLDFSRIESGRAEVSFEPTDLSAFTAELASVFRSAVERAGLALVVECPPLGVMTFVDREMWEKVVFNLLSNALKFTFDGSIHVSVRAEAGGICLAVRDTGTGIPASDVAHVFERFHRVQGARGRSIEGSGIGLALVQELAKLHGGRVDLESKLDRGSEFRVWLPLGDAHLPKERIGAARTLGSTELRSTTYVQEALNWLPSDPATSTREGAGDRPTPRMGDAAPLKLLLCEDNADMRLYLQRLLRESYDVEAVSDGRAALTAARRSAPDLVLTDVMLPGLDGFGLVRELRADERLKRVPIIMLSARAGESARTEGIRQGADDYLVKPFNARELLARISARLEVSRLERRLERKRADLAVSEARHRYIFEAAAVPIWEQDFSAVKRELAALRAAGVRDFESYLRDHPEFVEQARGLVRIVDVNDATVRMFGARDKAELLASLDALELPEARAFFARELAALAEGKTTFEGEVASRTLDGRALDVLIRVAFPPADNLAGTVLVSLTDITPQKAAERALREEAQTLETLNHVGRSLTAEVDLERILQVVTDAAKEVSGAAFGAFFYNVIDAKGEEYMLYTLSGAPRSAFEKFGQPRNTPVFAPTFKGEGPVRVADITKDPRYGTMAPHHGMPKGHLPVRSYLAVPVVSRAGEVLGGLFFGHSEVGVFSERAEQIVSSIASHAAVALDSARVYEQRAQLVEQLRESDRRKDEFLATLSHELRNPLAPLQNALQGQRLMGGATLGNGRIQEIMERQVGHLVRLVDDLLEMSRISRGTFELRRERVDIATVVRNAVETSEPLVRAGAHELSIVLPKEPLFVDGDPTRLTQILANLVNNAAKYTNAHGHVWVRARQAGESVLISVRDDGIGIAQSALKDIFEMFSRGNLAASKAQGGLGIGLALARRLAEMHGGSLEAASDGPGQGSQFTLRLPLAVSEPIPEVEPRPPAPASTRKRVLVVDDNVDAAETLGMLLEMLGAEVKVTHDGRSALAEHSSYAPDLIFLDIGMPEMDGHEVARRIRASEVSRRTLIVALTGWGQSEDRRLAREAGFDDHLVKPADAAALKAVLASLDSPQTRA